MDAFVLRPEIQFEGGSFAVVEGGGTVQKRLTQKSERVEMKKSVIFLLQKRTAAKKVLTNFSGLLRTTSCLFCVR